MKFSVNTQNCTQSIQKASSLTPSKTGMAMLATIWISAGNESISIMSTDASVEYCGTLPAVVEEEGRIGVSSRTFTDLFRALPAGTVELCTENDQAVLRQSGRTYRLPLVNADNFQALAPLPGEIQEGRGIPWQGKAFNELVAKVHFCIGDDTDSPIGCMVIRPTPEGKVHVCALDGNKFALCSIDNAPLYERLPRSGLLIQKKYITSLGRLMPEDDIVLGLDERRLHIVDGAGRDVVSVPLTPMDFPDYTYFVNKVEDDDCTVVTVSLEEISAVISRMSIFVSNESDGAQFTFRDGAITITSSARSVGTATEIIGATIDGPVETISFGVRTLSDIIQHLGPKGELEMRLTTSDGPCRFTSSGRPDYMIIAMPLNVEEESYYEEGEF